MLKAFVKAQKSRAYFKRYQVKFKRRRGVLFVCFVPLYSMYVLLVAYFVCNCDFIYCRGKN